MLERRASCVIHTDAEMNIMNMMNRISRVNSRITATPGDIILTLETLQNLHDMQLILTLYILSPKGTLEIKRKGFFY